MKNSHWTRFGLLLALGLGLGLALVLTLKTPPACAQAGCAPCDMTPPCANICAGEPPAPAPPPPDPGGGSGGNPQPTAVAPPDNPGATPVAGGTPVPPAALPGAGYWNVQCVDVGGEHGGGAGETGCGGSGYAIIWTWVVPNPALGYPSTYPARSRCAAPGECQPVTPTPRATLPPPPPNVWPCNTVPSFADGVLTQPCPNWPGYDLSVKVCIPGAVVRRYPWPRSLVGLPTKLWYGGAPDLEGFSNKALPCDVDYGARYPDTAFPTCPAPIGATTAGTRVNYQVGVAWRRWNSSRGAIFGFTPEHEVTWNIQDREWNGGNASYHDTYAVEHTFETSSYGLEEFGTRWNPACQEQTCDCDTRVAGMDMPAYDVSLTSWWYPEYTFKYDEMVCGNRGWSGCFWRASEPTGLTWRHCDGDGDGNNDNDWYEIETCTEYKWENQTDGWQKYNLSLIGYTPVVPWFIATQVGADANGNQCTATSYGPVGVPVIEVQPVGVP